MTKVGAGDLLIAPPNMLDPRFKNSVLLVTYHTQEHSMALCLNRPTGYSLKDATSSLDIEVDEDPEIFWGGPVAKSTLWLLHDSGWNCDGTVEINDRWSVSSSAEMFDYIRLKGWPNRYRMMLGHSGWGPGQLVSELEGVEPWSPDHSWLVAHNATPDWLLDSDPEQLWNISCSFCGQQAVDSWI
jgi:putative transcriptional regulator